MVLNTRGGEYLWVNARENGGGHGRHGDGSDLGADLPSGTLRLRPCGSHLHILYGFVPGALLVGFAVALVLLRREERGDGDKRRANDQDYSANG